MRRTALIASIALGVAAGGAGQASAKVRVLDNYCSPSGDFCSTVVRSNGRIKLELRTFSFQGPYTLCVRAPGALAECHDYVLTPDKHNVYQDRVDFARNFVHAAKGRYVVTWKRAELRIGKPLKFRRS